MNLQEEYAYATSCQMATLTGVGTRKSSAKCHIERHFEIALKMLRVCRLCIPDEITSQHSRIREVLEKDNLETSLYEWFMNYSVHGDFDPRRR